MVDVYIHRKTFITHKEILINFLLFYIQKVACEKVDIKNISKHI